MSTQNQEKVLIRSIRSKRALQKIYLPMYIAAVLLTVLFAFWMAWIVQGAELKQVSLEKNQKPVLYVQAKNEEEDEENKKEKSKLAITAEVNIAGKIAEKGEYSFILTDESGEEIATKTCNAKGIVKFNITTIEEAGEYVYQLRQNVGNFTDEIYDERVYTINVELVEEEPESEESEEETRDEDSDEEGEEREKVMLKVDSYEVRVEGEKVQEIQFLNEFREPVIEAFWASLIFGILCVFGPAVAIAHTMIHRRLRRASIVVTESRLMCRYRRRKVLDIPLRQVKNPRLKSNYLEAIGFVFAGKERSVLFIQNRQDILGVIERQKQAIEKAESEGNGR